MNSKAEDTWGNGTSFETMKSPGMGVWYGHEQDQPHVPRRALRGDLSQPPGNPPALHAEEVTAITRTIEVALSDAKYKGAFSDWVTVLEAREWLRHIMRPYLLEVLPAAVPAQNVHDAWLAEMEKQWAELDQEQTDQTVGALEQLSCVPQSLVNKYTANVQRSVLRAEREARRISEEIHSALLTSNADVKSLCVYLTARAERMEVLGATIGENADKLERLGNLLTTRGVKGATVALNSNLDTDEEDA